MADTRTMGVFEVILWRDITLVWRRRADLVNPLVFFLIVVTLFPLGVGPEPNLLSRMAPGIIWVAALLAAMLSLETIFHSDFEDGAIDQLLLTPRSTLALVLAKISAHWLVTGLPMVLFAPLLALLLGMQAHAIGVLLVTLVLGTPILSLGGAIGVALTVTRRGGGVLLSLLVLPLYIPILIFGAGAVDLAAGGLPVAGHLYLLGALLVLTVTLAPLAVTAAVRLSAE